MILPCGHHVQYASDKGPRCCRICNGELLPCGHPKECAHSPWTELLPEILGGDIPDDEPECQWCAEVSALREDAKALCKVLEEKAIVVNGGEVNVEGPIGYLALYNGQVNFPGTPQITLGELPGMVRFTPSVQRERIELDAPPIEPNISGA